MPKTMTPKQKRFVAEYLIDLNATQAAIRAGYAAKDADVQGPRLLGNVGIAEAIQKETEKRMNKLEITADRVLKQIALVAFSHVGPYIERFKDGTFRVHISPDLTDEQLVPIQEITVDEVGGGSVDGVRERLRRTRFKLPDKL